MKSILLLLLIWLNVNLVFGQVVVKPFIMFLDDKVIYSAASFNVYSSQNIKSELHYNPGKLTFRKSSYDSIINYSDSLNLLFQFNYINDKFFSSDRILLNIKTEDLDQRYYLLYIYTRKGKLRKKKFRHNKYKYYCEMFGPNLWGCKWLNPL